ncbi:MAG: Fe(3+) ABC transporter substrate-binding protein [Rubellimicrobium sp.]|nr:Fe(3+) ABC transporter substrate-binding protein [Rubellimicrobium sp.]
MRLRHLLLATALAAPLPALAEVNIYTTRQPELIQPVIDAFTAETGIAVNLAFVEEGIVERLEAEGSRSPADLVMTVDIANLKRIVDAGVVQPVDSDILRASIPEHLRSPDNLWFALTSRGRVVYASRDRVPEGAVTTYEDLASDTWRGRICTRSGTHNYNLALLAAMIAHHGEDYARTWAAGLHANLARPPEGGDRDQARAIWAGECDIALGNTYYVGKMQEDPEQSAWAEAIRVEFPTFEGGGTHINVSGIALTSAAPHRDEAVQLMEWLVSPEAQGIYAELNFEYPVLPGAPVSEVVAGWGEFTPDTVNLEEVAGHRAAALRIMEEVNFDG